MEQLQFLKTWMETNVDSVETLIFYTIVTLAIPLAYGVIFDRAVIRSGFLLIGVFGAISGLFLLLQAQFLAMAQIMIYAVGITLVVVIALMLTNPRLESDMTVASSKDKVGGFVIALLMFMTIYMAIRTESFPLKTEQVDVNNNVLVIGKALTTDYALPFEFSSILLLAALVGAVMLAKADPKNDTTLEYSEELSKDSDASKEEAFTATR
jgi:NADH:ubiquinone oxidoreductase subunit 6 (subunit J)